MPENMTKQEAANALRSRMIEDITRDSLNAIGDAYELTNMTCEDAADCFPGEADAQWDLASFKLNLRDGSLFVKLYSYHPDDDTPVQSRPLTADEFHAIVLKYDLDPILRSFETQEDWAALFDDKLKSVAANAFADLDQRSEASEIERRLEDAVEITTLCSNRSPEMYLLKVSLTYSDQHIDLVQKNRKYFLNGKPLSPAESVWVELETDSALSVSDNASVSDSRMSVIIKTKHDENVEITDEPALFDYINLFHSLEQLLLYGSITTAEKYALSAKLRKYERSENRKYLKSVMLQKMEKLLRRGK